MQFDLETDFVVIGAGSAGCIAWPFGSAPIRRPRSR